MNTLDYHPLAICITTCHREDTPPRTEVAVKTIQALKEHLDYPRIAWFIADDGSLPEHIDAIRNELIDETVTFTDAKRGGVGKSMNLALEEVWKLTHLVLLMEDDWELQHPINIEKYISVLMNNPQYGMIRMGWLSTGTRAELVGLDGHCWWKLVKNSHQYVYSGQVSLRHKRFYDAYGSHSEGVGPGQQEIDYCLKFSERQGPDILWPVEFSDWGPFVHIGHESLNSIQPEQT